MPFSVHVSHWYVLWVIQFCLLVSSVQADSTIQFLAKLTETVPLFPDLRLTDNDWFGWSVAMEGETLVIGSPGDHDMTGVVYVFQHESGWWKQKAELRASDGSMTDFFGYSVAIEGDTIIVGASSDEDFGNESGSAYVFVKPSEGWRNMTEIAKLTGSDTQAEDSFGIAVAVHHEYIFIGAPFHDRPAAANVGKVYIYRQPETGWISSTETSSLTPPEPAVTQWFGSALACTDSTLIVGAPAEKQLQGVAYAFNLTGIMVNSTEAPARLSPSDGGEFDMFGRSVAASGDTAAIFSDKNAVYMFEKPADGWRDRTEIAILKPNDEERAHDLSFSVAMDGDTVAAGTDLNGGAVYLFEKPIGGWRAMTQTATVRPSKPEINDFAWVLALSGKRLIAGARNDLQAAFQAGAAYIFEKTGDYWADGTESVKVTSGSNLPSGFGFAIAVKGDLAAVGAPESRKILLFEQKDNGWGYLATLTAGDTEPAAIGSTIAITENYVVAGDSNGISPVLQTDYTGVAYVFEKPAGGWQSMTATAVLYPSTVLESPRFGASVAASGDTIVIGDPAGRVYVFEKPEEGWRTGIETAILRSSDFQPNDRFGHAVSIAGDTVAVSAINKQTGAVYLYEKAGLKWTSMTETAKLVPNSPGHPTDYGKFGLSIHLDGDTLVAGSPRDLVGGIESGTVYIFIKPTAGWFSGMAPIARLFPSNGQPLDLFGGSVFHSEGKIIVCSPNSHRERTGPTQVYFFEKPAGGWVDRSENAILTAADEETTDAFGTSVGITESEIWVGAPYDRYGGETTGSIYRYFVQDSQAVVERFDLY